jgi:hypothetical protein
MTASFAMARASSGVTDSSAEEVAGIRAMRADKSIALNSFLPKGGQTRGGQDRPELRAAQL